MREHGYEVHLPVNYDENGTRRGNINCRSLGLICTGEQIVFRVQHMISKFAIKFGGYLLCCSTLCTSDDRYRSHSNTDAEEATDYPVNGRVYI